MDYSLLKVGELEKNNETNGERCLLKSQLGAGSVG